jgi:flagellar biosynthesis/type III secretory pathway chaperone
MRRAGAPVGAGRPIVAGLARARAHTRAGSARTMSLTAPANPFAALVREFALELMHLKQMIALAEDEHRDLVAGDTSRLDAIASEKLVQLRALELYRAQRAAYLAAQGFTADASGLAACTVSAGSRGRELTTAWKRVADALAELHDLNEENGALLRARLAKAGGQSVLWADLAKLERE